MIRHFLKIAMCVTASAVLTGCSSGILGNPTTNAPNFQPFPGQGQYITPQFLLPELPQPLPPEDLCRSRLYLTLVGQHEGSIFIAGLPGRKRIVKPAELEDFEIDIAQRDFIAPPPLVEVIDFLPQQSIYAGSIRTVTDRSFLTDEDQSRLTLELDSEGYIQEVRCG